MSKQVKTGCFLPRDIRRCIEEEANNRGVLISEFITKIISENYKKYLNTKN